MKKSQFTDTRYGDQTFKFEAAEATNAMSNFSLVIKSFIA